MTDPWKVESMDENLSLATLRHAETGETRQMDHYEACALMLRDMRGLECLEEELATVDGRTIKSSILRVSALDVAIAVLKDRSATWRA